MTMRMTRRANAGSRFGRRKEWLAFTLIEMLVVIAIIAILSSMVMAGFGAFQVKGAKNRLLAECQELDFAINNYKAKTGSFPPDNQYNSALSPLVYELGGSVYNPADPLLGGNPSFRRLSDPAATANLFNTNDVLQIFGPPTLGFLNSSDVTNQIKHVKELGPDKVGEVAYGKYRVNLLRTPKSISAGTNYYYIDFSGASPATNLLNNNTPNAGRMTDLNGEFVNVWHYRTTPPIHNSGGFDLWTVVVFGKQTNIICNWQRQPIKVN